MKSKTLITFGIGLALAIFVYGTALRTAASKSPGTASSVTSVVKPAPDFELKSLDGRTVKLSDFHGKAVLLNFWATYCTPCRVEMPWLVDLYNQYHEQGLEIIGVSMDDEGEEQRVADFVREINVNYLIVLGNHTVGDAFGGTQFLPKTFFIDRQGNISSTTTGMKSKSEFEAVIKQLLADAHATQESQDLKEREATQKKALAALASQQSHSGHDCPKATTTYDENVCLNKASDETQKAFGVFYDNLSLLLGNVDRTKLDRAEAQWIEYRKLSCDAVGELFRGGTIRPSREMECKIALTRSRMRDLADLYDLTLHK